MYNHGGCRRGGGLGRRPCPEPGSRQQCMGMLCCLYGPLVRSTLQAGSPEVANLLFIFKARATQVILATEN